MFVSAIRHIGQMLTDNRPQITTARLLLRPLVMADFADYIPALNDWNIARWLSRVPSPYGLEDAAYWLAKTHSKWQAGEELALIARRLDNDALAGGISLFLTDGEIGFWVTGNQTGQGLAKEILAALIDYAFTHTQLPEVFCATMPENAASRAVQQAVGMEYIDDLPYEFNPARCDSQTAPIYQMTRAAWLNRNKGTARNPSIDGGVPV